MMLTSLQACHKKEVKKNIDSQKIQVAAHRGDWRNYTENSLEAIQGAIDMGVDIAEIDIAKTKDGHIVLMHDKKVDRTTNGKGLVSDFTLAEIKDMKLKNGLGRITDFKVPTLEEVMILAKGKILVNIDKGDKYFDDVYEILRKTGTVDQAIIKSNKPYEVLLENYGDNLNEMIFMPVINLNDGITYDSIRPTLEKGYPFYELVFKDENKDLLNKIQKTLNEKGSQIWINSLWDSLCGGYSDDKALKNREKIYGYLIDSLDTRIIQTDRPAFLIEYLQERGMHN